MDLTKEQLQIFTDKIFQILDSDEEIYISYQSRIIRNSADIKISCFAKENLLQLTNLGVTPPYNEKLPFPWSLNFFDIIRSLIYDEINNFNMIMQIFDMYLQTIPIIKDIKDTFDIKGKGTEKFQYYSNKFFNSLEEYFNKELKNTKVKFAKIQYGIPYYYTTAIFDLYTKDGICHKNATYSQKKIIEKGIANVLNKILQKDLSSYYYYSNMKTRFSDGGILTAPANSFYIQIKNNDYTNIGMDPILEDIPILSLKK